MGESESFNEEMENAAQSFMKGVGRAILKVVAGVALIATLAGYTLRDAPFDYRRTCQAIARDTTSYTRDYGVRTVIIDYEDFGVPDSFRFYSNHVLRIVDKFDRSEGYGKVDQVYTGLIEGYKGDRPFDPNDLNMLRLPCGNYEIISKTSIRPQSELFAVAERKYKEVDDAVTFMNSNRTVDKACIDVINCFRLPPLDTIRVANLMGKYIIRDIGEIVDGQHKFQLQRE